MHAVSTCQIHQISSVLLLISATLALLTIPFLLEALIPMASMTWDPSFPKNSGLFYLIFSFYLIT